MKILLIECAQTVVRPVSRYDSAGFTELCRRERTEGVVPLSVTRRDASGYVVYTGTGPAPIETAEALFSFGSPPKRTPLLDDVPLRAFRETKKRYPIWLWRAAALFQWRTGLGRQPETRSAAGTRAGDMIDLAEREGKDCVLLARGLFLKTLRDTLYRRGYCIQGGGFRIRPLDRIRATKQTLHCGGCIHNCMLDNPGCGIGKVKAAERRSPS